MVSEELRTLIAKAAEVESTKQTEKQREQIGRNAMRKREQDEHERRMSLAGDAAVHILAWTRSVEAEELCVEMAMSHLHELPLSKWVSILSSGTLRVRSSLKYFGSRVVDAPSARELVGHAGARSVLAIADHIRTGRILDVIAGLLKESVS